mmetsp:Transcript_75611/g.138257  ORF Transcript_75611/g.138257 Transcript_75611/m.138257 type:complete len:82 (+) Transcript_75611:176-421(+)
MGSCAIQAPPMASSCPGLCRGTHVLASAHSMLGVLDARLHQTCFLQHRDHFILDSGHAYEHCKSSWPCGYTTLDSCAAEIG